MTAASCGTIAADETDQNRGCDLMSQPRFASLSASNVLDGHAEDGQHLS
ncbi:MAG: hypothetical protein ABIZ05_02450 [Pseudonocardiaceae bacterium]